MGMADLGIRACKHCGLSEEMVKLLKDDTCADQTSCELRCVLEDNERLTAQLAASSEALRLATGLLAEIVRGEDNPSGAFDEVAEEFYRETLMIAPGKSIPLAMNPGYDEDERQGKWREFRKARRVAWIERFERCRAALERAGKGAK